MSGVSFRDVACVRGGRLLFEGVSFTAAAGEAVLVSGPNGSGKSSLIRLAAGLLAPAAGEIRIGGRVALLGEQPALDAELGLADALRFWGRMDRSEVEGALARTGLAPLRNVPVRLLSTGQRRRAALARVLASGAAIWLLDEPASGLDAASVATLEDLIAEHRAAGGVILLATHQPVTLGGAIELALGGFA